MNTRKLVLSLLFSCVVTVFMSCDQSGITTGNPAETETKVISASKEPINPTSTPSTIVATQIANTPTQESEITKRDCDNVSIANPAASYCLLLGYSYNVVEVKEGQIGVCILPDGTICDGWLFYSGKCGRKYSYCAIQGFETKTLTDGKDPFSPEYAVCVDKSGNVLGSVSDLSGLKTLLTNCE